MLNNNYVLKISFSLQIDPVRPRNHSRILILGCGGALTMCLLTFLLLLLRQSCYSRSCFTKTDSNLTDSSWIRCRSTMLEQTLVAILLVGVFVIVILQVTTTDIEARVNYSPHLLRSRCLEIYFMRDQNRS